MTSVSLNLYSSAVPPSADVLALESGERFIVLHLDETVSVILDGHELKAVTAARALADVLNNAADRIEMGCGDQPGCDQPQIEGVPA